ncbi:unnamed protein product, partial [Iphiclides podalirius]
MTRHTVHGFACLLLLVAVTWGEREQTRWSRQISTYTADISDWVPLPGPVERDQPQGKRQPVAEPRILSEPFPSFTRPTAFTQGGGFNQEPFPSRTFYNTPANRQLYLQSLPSVPSAPQNFLTEQGFGQSIRFGLSQPNFPLNQGFVAPQLSFDTVPQTKPIKFENVQKTSQSQKPQVQTFITQAPKFKPDLPKFYDGYRIQNVSNDFNTKRPQSLQKLKYDGVKTETLAQNKPQVEREEVQLLYVPLESLNSGQFNFRNPVASPHIINSDLYNQIQRQVPLKTPIINNPSTDFQKATTKAVENFNPRQEFSSNLNTQIRNFDQVPKFTTLASPFPTIPPSTSKPKKLKPHQPPLAIFLTQDEKKDKQVRVGDVLYSLKNANTIAVLDAVNPQSAPKVFIGPSSLSPPEKYVKFELPYLSNIENSEKKLRQLPFFVAPLSYNTPQGFAKIPFPSPHVGSVVINSQISKDSQPTTTVPNIPPSFYTYNQSPPKQEQSLEFQNPRINYYTTASPKTKTPTGYEPNYYSFEQQAVNPLTSPEKPNTGSKPTSYFLSNIGNQYNPSDYVNFPSEPNYQTTEGVQTYSIAPTARTVSTQKPTTTTTTPSTPTTTTTTTIKPSTYPSQLLETHNPYSINQAFHFSTPIDYQNFFDEYKENYAAPGQNSSPQQATETNISTTSQVSVPQEREKTQMKYSQGSPNYLQGYTPEIHYESEVQNSRFGIYSTNQEPNESTERYMQTNNPVVYNKSYEPTSNLTPVVQNENFESNNTYSPIIQNENIEPSSQLTPPRNEPERAETKPVLPQSNDEILNNTPFTSYDNHIPVTGPTYDYNKYETTFNNYEHEQTPQSTSSTTTTTRRTLLRTRGRPRYPTSKPDTGEYTSKATITRRPLRERRPLANRPRYEPNKITTEKQVLTEKPSRSTTDSVETTTKYKRTRTRGRVHYKPSESDDIYEKRLKAHSSKENDLAYQRDVLHQNYPVTLMERLSTVDIEPITEPTVKVSATSVQRSEDTENAYSYEKVSVTEHTAITENKDDQHEYTDALTKDVPNPTSTHNDEYSYQSKTSSALVGTYPTYDEAKGEDIYNQQTTPLHATEILEATTQSVDESEQSISVTNRPNNQYDEEITTKDTEHGNNEANNEESTEQQENVVQTTPSYNRVRVRPGVIRQYHPASTDSSRVRADRRRPAQGITYRPAYDRRRTTMRIDEIEADLKTKQVHSRPEFQDYKHPVYKPEPTTESTETSSPIQETSTRRGSYRRRRPTYTVSSTETPTNKRTYEIKNRFRGRRPTEKPEVQTEQTSTTTVRDTPVVKYNDRPRLSERFNQSPEPEETETGDQDPNYSIQRPSYATLDANRWSPKISPEYFKPYNPNDIADESKALNEDHQTDNGSELDIITAKNEYDNILISVTPATNNRANKKIPDIPPTLEALVEQSRITKSESGDTMSTFESMLEEVMKSLEEQDEDEYTKNVMKHKGGEIGEIPPEKIITSEENFYSKSTTPLQEITTTAPYEKFEDITEKEINRKTRRRGFWKKVKVRPATESIEVAESQYYPNTVNRLGQSVQVIRLVAT